MELSQTNDITEDDRSATVFGVRSCFYTFVQQQMS